MARKKYSKGKKSFTIPLAVVGGFVPPVAGTVATFQATGDIQTAGNYMTRVLTGYDIATNRFSLGNMKAGLLPIGLGILVHKYVGGIMGVNRALAAAGMPILRL